MTAPTRYADEPGAVVEYVHTSDGVEMTAVWFGGQDRSDDDPLGWLVWCREHGIPVREVEVAA